MFKTFTNCPATIFITLLFSFLWTKVEIFSQIFNAAFPAPALSCNSGSSAAAWTQPGCIPGINVRGDTASSLLCRGYQRWSCWDTHSGPFLAALGWLFIFISKLSASADMTRLDERRLCRAVRSLPPPYSLFYMYSETLHQVSSVLQMNAFSILVLLIKKKSVCVVRKNLRGDFGVKLERRHCRLLCDAAAEAAWGSCWRSAHSRKAKKNVCSDSNRVCLNEMYASLLW